MSSIPSQPADSSAVTRASITTACVGNKPTVLLADENPLVLAKLGHSLRETGLEMIEVLDAISALTACIGLKPSLAVIGWPLNGAHGAELARMIATQTSVPFIFLTTGSDAGTIREAIEAGALACLVKPVEAEQFLAAVHTALRLARDLHALRTRVDHLNAALRTERNVCVATGLLMAKFHLSQQEAFERLRRYARSKRTRVEQIATELLTANDQAGRMFDSLSQRASTRQAAAGD
jgi:response regulator NasT